MKDFFGGEGERAMIRPAESFYDRSGHRGRVSAALYPPSAGSPA